MKIGIVGIYKITSPSGRIYIGQSWNIKRRFSQYKSGPPKTQAKLCNSFSKYGYEQHIFEIIHELSIDNTQELLDYFEVYYMNYYRDLGIDLLNLKEGGSRGKNCQETIQKMRRPKTKQWKKRIGIANSGKVRSQEARLKNSLVKKGQYPGTAKRVINLDTKEVYPSARVASEILKIPHSTMKSMLNGYRLNKTNLQYENRYNVACN